MTVSKFERFAVRRPLRDSGLPAVDGRQSPPMIYMSSGQVAEAGVYVELAWITGIPQPHPLLAAAQVLDHDQVLLHIGMDPRTPQVLGGTVELHLGGQPIVFNTTTAVFIPKGTPYGRLRWREFTHPHLQVCIVLGSGDPYGTAGRPGAGGRPAAAAAPAPVAGGAGAKVDYEQYVVRSPMREAGPDYVEGRQNPTMTYMSGIQVPGVKDYIEFGWIWQVPSSRIPKMRHDNFDELVLHIGSDPGDPEDLGATMQIGVGEDLLEFDTTHCAFFPRELDHGPLIWNEVRRPMIEFAMMLGAANWAQGWDGSFFEESDGS